MTIERLQSATLIAALIGACAAKPQVPAQTAKPHVKLSQRASTTALAPPAKSSAQLPLGAARMQEPGLEARALQQRVGRWDVVATFRASPQAEPVVTKGLIADRAMVGLYLEEVMKPGPGSPVPDFRRTSYLTYSRLEGRWQFVSIDTRMPVGIMPAYSFGKESPAKVSLIFESLAFVGMGPSIEGRMVRSNCIITRDSLDHDVAEQHWVQSDGSEGEWLAVQYDYSRQPTQ